MPPILQLKAIAAMAENRAIGLGNRIPWHLPEDFRWFKATTTGHTLLMGRKTFESIGKPLPNRQTLVLTRGAFTHPGVTVIHSLSELRPLTDSGLVFVAGGADIYAQLLPACSDLFLTRVHQQVAGDTFFPPFEDRFEPFALLQQTPQFSITHYVNRNPTQPGV